MDVNNSLRQKLKEAKNALADSEQALDENVRALKKVTAELHSTKEDLASMEERAEKLEATIVELKARLNVRKISAGSQAVASRYDVGSQVATLTESEVTCTSLELDELRAELEAHKRGRASMEDELKMFQINKDNVSWVVE
eukprot:sb/3474263/